MKNILHRTLFFLWAKNFLLFFTSTCFLFILIDSSLHLSTEKDSLLMHYFYILLNYQTILISFTFLFATIKTILTLNSHQLPLVLQLSQISYYSIIKPILQAATLILFLLCCLNERFYSGAYHYKHHIVYPQNKKIEQFILSNKQTLFCIKQGSLLSQGYLLINPSEIWHVESFSLNNKNPHLHRVTKLLKSNDSGFIFNAFEKEIELYDIKLSRIISKSDAVYFDSLPLISLVKTLSPTLTINSHIILTRIYTLIFPLYIILLIFNYLLKSRPEQLNTLIYLYSLGYFIIQIFCYKTALLLSTHSANKTVLFFIFIPLTIHLLNSLAFAQHSLLYKKLHSILRRSYSAQPRTYQSE